MEDLLIAVSSTAMTLPPFAKFQKKNGGLRKSKPPFFYYSSVFVSSDCAA